MPGENNSAVAAGRRHETKGYMRLFGWFWKWIFKEKDGKVTMKKTRCKKTGKIKRISGRGMERNKKSHKNEQINIIRNFKCNNLAEGMAGNCTERPG